MSVYQPAEDTFLLADTLFRHMKHELIVLEIGCGSGYITEFIKKHFDPLLLISTDVNVDAAKSVKTNADVIVTDLMSGIRIDVDVVVFNPPYVPTPSEEINVGGITAAWAGGIEGVEVINRFLDCFSAREGYIIFLQQSLKFLKFKNLNFQILSVRNAGIEKLCCCRIWK